MYTLNMLAIALELAKDDPVYEDVATKFLEHFLYIADAMNNLGDDGIALWDEHDGFYYDVLHLSNGEHVPAARAIDGRPDPALRRSRRWSPRCSRSCRASAGGSSGSCSTGRISPATSRASASRAWANAGCCRS